MRLSDTEKKLYFKLYPSLLLYANDRDTILSKAVSRKEFFSLPLEEKMKLRDSLYGNMTLIDSFLKDNPHNFTAPELDIIRSWKHLIKGKFYVIRNLKKYSLFLSDETPERAYGVLSLTDTVDEIAGRPLPLLIETALLPFNGKIITDGFIVHSNVYFGSGIRQRLDDSYQAAKARCGVITELPFSEHVEARTPDEKDTELLRYYMKSQHNRDTYGSEIYDLILKSSKLMTVYQQEMGRINANIYKKRLRKSGFKDAWFAILEGNIVAGGKEEKDIQATLRKILPPDKKEYVYYFHLKD